MPRLKKNEYQRFWRITSKIMNSDKVALPNFTTDPQVITSLSVKAKLLGSFFVSNSAIKDIRHIIRRFARLTEHNIGSIFHYQKLETLRKNTGKDKILVVVHKNIYSTLSSILPKLDNRCLKREIIHNSVERVKRMHGFQERRWKAHLPFSFDPSNSSLILESFLRL